jgi:hypothetical protein
MDAFDYCLNSVQDMSWPRNYQFEFANKSMSCTIGRTMLTIHQGFNGFSFFQWRQVVITQNIVNFVLHSCWASFVIAAPIMGLSIPWLLCV